MARKPMITRTFKGEQVTVLMADINAGEMFNNTCLIPRIYKKESKRLEHVKQILETDNLKVVSIVSVDVKETRRGMTEEEFIQYSKELEPLKKYYKTDEELQPNEEEKF